MLGPNRRELSAAWWFHEERKHLYKSCTCFKLAQSEAKLHYIVFMSYNVLVSRTNKWAPINQFTMINLWCELISIETRLGCFHSPLCREWLLLTRIKICVVSVLGLLPKSKMFSTTTTTSSLSLSWRLSDLEHRECSYHFQVSKFAKKKLAFTCFHRSKAGGWKIATNLALLASNWFQVRLLRCSLGFQLSAMDYCLWLEPQLWRMKHMSLVENKNRNKYKEYRVWRIEGGQ